MAIRPEILNNLFSSVEKLPGVGPKVGKMIAKLVGKTDRQQDGIPTISDILWHAPVALIDRSLRPTIDNAPHERVVTLEVVIGKHRVPPRHNRRIPYTIEASDETGTIRLTFFNAHADYLKSCAPEGSRRFVSGKVEWFQNKPQMVHPDHILTAEEFADLPLIEPVYPMTAGLSPKTFKNAVTSALQYVPVFAEWQNDPWLKKKPMA